MRARLSRCDGSRRRVVVDVFDLARSTGRETVTDNEKTGKDVSIGFRTIDENLRRKVLPFVEKSKSKR